MSTKWLTTMKPSFQTEWLALPPKEAHQVLEKISLLTQDPMPDGKVKKKLKYMGGKLHRIRCGDYRIFYTFEQPYISLLALRRRIDDTYDEDFDIEFLGGLEPELRGTASTVQPDWERIFAPRKPEKKALPEPITKELLAKLLVPEEYHTRLLPLQTQEDLLECPDVPDEILLKIDECMFERPLAQVIQQEDYILQEVDDLLRFKEGKLLGFLLKLSPEQEKAADWSMNVTGPTQVKGNPGTGKSTVALYRVQSLIQKLGEMGMVTPRILYTTYTNALVKSSEQLLNQLLGNDFRYVTVKTADRLVWEILEQANENLRIANDAMLVWLIEKVVKQIQAEGKLEQLKVLEQLNSEYLLEEICQVIIARQIKTLDEYLTASRSGRKLGLDKAEREVVWKVYEILLQLLQRKRMETWQQARLKAEAICSNEQSISPYDAVVVDEAQDLDPSVLRLLFGLCKAANRFFITADANQSIYRTGFTWSDVHESLKFQGRRTTTLKTNYRSTRQISEAARSYLANGALETEAIDNVHLFSGPMPMVCRVQSSEEEIQILSSSLPGAVRECRVLLGSCAVLCPTSKIGMAVAKELSKRGVIASFMKRKDINLEYSGVKVLTIHSSKGLEFPVVALAGFIDSRYARGTGNNLGEEQKEASERDRRTIFVGMTRAMRTLLLIVPAWTRSPLLTGFDDHYWHIKNVSETTIPVRSM